MAKPAEPVQELRSKASVGYKLGGDHCDVCKHFVEGESDDAPGSCELVAGEIGEDMWCKLFRRKVKTLADGGGYK